MTLLYLAQCLLYLLHSAAMRIKQGTVERLVKFQIPRKYAEKLPGREVEPTGFETASVVECNCGMFPGLNIPEVWLIPSDALEGSALSSLSV